MAIDVLPQEAQGMSEETLMEALRNTSDLPEIEPIEKPKRRHAGIYKGQIVMADDFDAPLDDFTGYM